MPHWRAAWSISMDILFFVNSAALGVGLAMDAFSVSLANGLREPRMRKQRMCLIAGTYALFQFLMPVIGWICVRFLLDIFSFFEKLVPWVALLLLLYIGGKMLLEGIRNLKAHRAGNAADAAADPQDPRVLGGGTLFLQGIATSIDALSVGFTIADLSFAAALTEALIIGAVTFAICIGGLHIGKRFGSRLSDRASILGGCVLIFIGVEIFLSHMHF